MTTESDRELLELAAKAYWGDEIDDVCSIRWLEEDQAIGYTHGDNQDHNGVDREFVWNPLTDDGDALRLAMKLRISPSFRGYATEGQGFAEASYSNPRNSHTTVKERTQVAYIPEEMFNNPRHSKFATYMMEDYGDELVRGFEVATRRAIVRAAAEIARATHKEGA